jgi:hypothetical protein
MRIGFATDTVRASLSSDDRAAIAPLAALGVDVVPVVWTDPDTAWAGLDAVVIRSTWDYHRRFPEFLAWVDRVAARTPLWNPPEVVRWNAHKSYLLDLARQGVPTVPTRPVPDLAAAVATARANGWGRSVVKSAVSAGAYRTYLVDLATFDPASPPWGDAPPAGELLVQPYLREVEGRGERSLVFFRGAYSHAFLRAPRLAGRTPLEEGRPVRASPAELEVGERALAGAPGPTVYARADIVTDTFGVPRLMELELIEPYLGLGRHRPAAEAFARALAHVLRRS